MNIKFLQLGRVLNKRVFFLQLKIIQIEFDFDRQLEILYHGRYSEKSIVDLPKNVFFL